MQKKVNAQTPGFKVAAGCRRQPTLWPLLPAIFPEEIEKDDIPSLDRQNQCP